MNDTETDPENRIYAFLDAHMSLHHSDHPDTADRIAGIARADGDLVLRVSDLAWLLGRLDALKDETVRLRLWAIGAERERDRHKAVVDAARVFLAAWHRGEDETHALDEADALDTALDELSAVA